MNDDEIKMTVHLRINSHLKYIEKNLTRKL